MSQIYAEMKEICNFDPNLQAAVLVEGFFVVENSCKELGKVTSDIFDKKLNHVTCENVTKLAFLEQVLIHFCELIEGLRGIQVCEVVSKIFNIEKNLFDISLTVNSLKDRPKDMKKQNYSVEITQNDSIDEIVNFINGDFKEIKKKARKRRRVSKVSTAETSGSPFDRRSRDEIWKAFDEAIQNGELEKEIHEFQCTLEQVKPCLNKPKPCLSDEWLNNMRTLILKNHTFANKF